MLAGSNDNAAAAFDLLLADPNLVIGGIPVDEDDGGENGKKRKRSPSMLEPQRVTSLLGQRIDDYLSVALVHILPR